jgi:hypothetical protein
MWRPGSQLLRSRWIRAAALLHYFWLVTGLPLPVRADKDSSIPFPCMQRSCGCRDAEQCARSCCCFSRTEQIAWYRERGLIPPNSLYGIQAPQSETTATRSPKRACCCSQSMPAEATICESPIVAETKATTCRLSLSAESDCLGLVKGGLFCMATLVPPVVCLPAPAGECDRAPSPAVCWSSYVIAPTPPPPRRAA